MQASEAYRRLTARSRRASLLGSIGSVLSWDQQVNLPVAAGEYRAEQLAEMSRQEHEAWVSDEVGHWLEEVEKTEPRLLGDAVGEPEEVVRANVREWGRIWRRKRALPQRLVEELARESALGYEAWVEARKQSSFPFFLPRLRRIVELVREQADCWTAAGLAQKPYDALLDEYEAGMREEDLANLFEPMVGKLKELIERGESAWHRKKTELPPGPYPMSAQQAFNREVAEAIGFDFERGRVDSSVHPFCTTLGPGDVRLTTRYDEHDFTNSLFGVLHEAGHGMYEQGTEKRYFGTPAGSAVSLGVHESQSRMWENCVGRSLEFWQRWLPVAAQYFPQLKRTTPEQVWRHVNRVERGFIRVDADEVTYDLHVVLRFQIERSIFCGQTAVEDLPEVWNSLFLDLFGKKVPDDSLGCLQDVHWSGGAFGYFPTYTLGNIYAANLFAAAGRENPRLKQEFAAGEYRGLLEWLREKVHRWGSVFPARDLVTQATGGEVNPRFHLERLQEKVEKLDKLG